MATRAATGSSAKLAVGPLLADARARLARVGDSARLDAELLLAHVCACPRAALVAFPERVVSAASARAFEALVTRRARGEPVAYLTGSQGFHAVTLAVSPAVLVPRPETELIVDEMLARRGAGTRARVLDLGTGSGAIALAVKHARPRWHVTAVDSSPAALDVAAANGRALELDVDWRAACWFDALDADERFDFIACNPPYVASADPHFDGPLAHEPRAALDGGADGLAAIRAVLAGAGAYLAAGGLLLVEHGCDQRARVRELAHAHGYAEAAARDDLAGRARLIVLARGAP